jgi:hypothetical protein
MKIAACVLIGLLLTGCAMNCGLPSFKAEKQMEVSCEAGNAFEVSTGNGTIQAAAGEGECRVTAYIEAKAMSPAQADELLQNITVRLEKHDGLVKVVVDKPLAMFGKSVDISYKVVLPAETRLKLNTANGQIKIFSIKGAANAHTVNGSVTIEDAGGDIEAGTVNGGVNLRCNPDAAIKNIRANTVNGSVSVSLPKSFGGAAKLSTVNGSIHSEAGLAIKGDIARSHTPARIDGTIGSGDGQLEVATVNGAIRLQ